jgi:hypothetical protein
MTAIEHREVSAMADDDITGGRTAWVRIAYAVTAEGRVDTDRVGKVEELPYGEAKRLVKDGRAQYVDGPDGPGPDGGEAVALGAEGPQSVQLTEPLVPGGGAPAGFVRTRRNDPETPTRMGAWGAKPVEKPDEAPGDVAARAVQQPAEAAAVPDVDTSTVDSPGTEPAAADTSTVGDEATASITTDAKE